MNPMLNIAIQAVRQAGRFITKQYEILNTNTIKTIKHKNNLLLKINTTINQLISNTIKKYYPLHIIHTQHNRDYSNIINNETQWIINTLDSQTNFIKHLPYFALSIAVKIKGRTEISVIYDPIHNDLFSASRGQGTQLNGYRIHNHMTKKIFNNYIIVNYIPHYQQHIITNLIHKSYQTQESIKFRHSGAITLDLAYVAAGRIDAIFASDLKTCKFDSGALLIKEAGGLIMNINNKTHKNIIAGHPKIVKIFNKNTYT